MTGWEWFIEVLSWVMIITGSISAIIGAFGAYRFPDFWSRLHAVSITDTAGVILLIAGMCLQSGLTLITVKLIAIGLFLFITGPTATHAAANAAYISGLMPNRPEGQEGAD